ncbi:MAG: hypothetical protein ABSD49_10010 [Candidatus Bathyarchaeia archaeon]
MLKLTSLNDIAAEVVANDNLIEETEEMELNSSEPLNVELEEPTIELTLEPEPPSIENVSNLNPEAISEPLPVIEAPPSEIEVLSDVEDLMHELEPEIEQEQEEVELSY